MERSEITLLLRTGLKRRVCIAAANIRVLPSLCATPWAVLRLSPSVRLFEIVYYWGNGRGGRRGGVAYERRLLHSGDRRSTVFCVHVELILTTVVRGGGGEGRRNMRTQPLCS